jgi:hypothetical protein
MYLLKPQNRVPLHPQHLVLSFRVAFASLSFISYRRLLLLSFLHTHIIASAVTVVQYTLASSTDVLIPVIELLSSSSIKSDHTHLLGLHTSSPISSEPPHLLVGPLAYLIPLLPLYPHPVLLHNHRNRNQTLPVVCLLVSVPRTAEPLEFVTLRSPRSRRRDAAVTLRTLLGILGVCCGALHCSGDHQRITVLPDAPPTDPTITKVTETTVAMTLSQVSETAISN